MKSSTRGLWCSAALILSLVARAGNAQSNQSSSSAQESLADRGIATLRVTTREVLIDVIAVRGRDEAVLDLKPEELKVSESFISLDRADAPHPTGSPELETVTSLRVVDPNARASSTEKMQSELQVNATCLERSTVHYRLAFHPGPDGWQSGYHRVVISTRRPGIRLFYRHQYYVGLKEAPAKPAVVQSQVIDNLIMKAACYHPETPASITLQAKFIDSGRTDVLRYSVAIDADSLSFVTLEKNANNAGVNRYVALDYGVCSLDRSGFPINFFHAPLEKVLSSADYARALDRGFPHVLEFPAAKSVAVTRFVVRDRQTGNLGVATVVSQGVADGPALRTALPAVQTASDLKASEAYLNLDSMRDSYGGRSIQLPASMRAAAEPVGSFGSVISAPHAFCGDVYELPGKPETLPDFREFDPIASLYTSVLDVPNQLFSNSTRIPGQPPGIPFGVDYHGVVWVTVPGDYRFLLLSDDGAVLRIDDKKLIDVDGVHGALPGSGRIHLEAGRHSVEVAYFENAEGEFALELWVKPPGARQWRLFDGNDYAAPAAKDN